LKCNQFKRLCSWQRSMGMRFGHSNLKRSHGHWHGLTVTTGRPVRKTSKTNKYCSPDADAPSAYARGSALHRQHLCCVPVRMQATESSCIERNCHWLLDRNPTVVPPAALGHLSMYLLDCGLAARLVDRVQLHRFPSDRMGYKDFENGPLAHTTMC